MTLTDPEEFIDEQTINEFSTILTHMYRGEIQRSYNWRARLDATTNWAILLLSALITWTYSDPGYPHELLLFSLLFTSLLLGIESRRFMYFNLWHSRVRALERDFLARSLNPKEEVTSRRWMADLAKDLKNPHFKISYWEAISHRLRHVYVWLFTICVVLWLGKLIIHPAQTNKLSVVVARAQVFGISGTVVFSALIAFFIVIIIIALTVPKIYKEGDWDSIKLDKKYIEEWDKDI